MGARKGDRLRSILTGKVYEVKAIKDLLAVLKSLDGSSQVWTERDSLELFYETVEDEESSLDYAPSPAPRPSGPLVSAFPGFPESTTCHLQKAHNPIRGKDMGLFPFLSL